jgi:hypothetical protein
VTLTEIESLCDDGEMLDGLVSRFDARVKAGMKFGHVLTALAQAQAALDRRMSLAADAVEAVAAAEANNPAACRGQAGETVPHEYHPHSGGCVHCGKPRGA